jgi:hypothetical protein
MSLAMVRMPVRVHSIMKILVFPRSLLARATTGSQFGITERGGRGKRAIRAIRAT